MNQIETEVFDVINTAKHPMYNTDIFNKTQSADNKSQVSRAIWKLKKKGMIKQAGNEGGKKGYLSTYAAASKKAPLCQSCGIRLDEHDGAELCSACVMATEKRAEDRCQSSVSDKLPEVIEVNPTHQRNRRLDPQNTKSIEVIEAEIGGRLNQPHDNIIDAIEAASHRTIIPNAVTHARRLRAIADWPALNAEVADWLNDLADMIDQLSDHPEAA